MPKLKFRFPEEYFDLIDKSGLPGKLQGEIFYNVCQYELRGKEYEGDDSRLRTYMKIWKVIYSQRYGYGKKD